MNHVTLNIKRSLSINIQLQTNVMLLNIDNFYHLDESTNWQWANHLAGEIHDKDLYETDCLVKWCLDAAKRSRQDGE